MNATGWYDGTGGGGNGGGGAGTGMVLQIPVLAEGAPKRRRPLEGISQDSPALQSEVVVQEAVKKRLRCLMGRPRAAPPIVNACRSCRCRPASSCSGSLGTDVKAMAPTRRPAATLATTHHLEHVVCLGEDAVFGSTLTLRQVNAAIEGLGPEGKAKGGAWYWQVTITRRRLRRGASPSPLALVLHPRN